MQFIKDTTEGANLITGLDTNAIRVNQQIHHDSLIISVDHIAPWPIHRVSQIDQNAWQGILATSPELIILGTGEKLVFPDPSQLQAIYAQNIGIEIMDSSAACRTFNLLVHEGRKVTAGMILAQKID